MGHKIPKERSRLYKLRKTIADLESMLRCNREITVYFPEWSMSTAEIEKNLKKARKEELEELKRRGFPVEEEKIQKSERD
jgi:hypothetical protein